MASSGSGPVIRRIVLRSLVKGLGTLLLILESLTVGLGKTLALHSLAVPPRAPRKSFGAMDLGYFRSSGCMEVLVTGEVPVRQTSGTSLSL